jgi:hypothetical protein
MSELLFIFVENMLAVHVYLFLTVCCVPLIICKYNTILNSIALWYFFKPGSVSPQTSLKVVLPNL